MISEEEALHIAIEHIAREVGDDFILKNNTVAEHQFVYLFYYHTKGIFSYARYTDIVLGPRPNLIDKYDGAVISGYPGESEGEIIIRYYNEKGYAHTLELDEHREIDGSSAHTMSQEDIDLFLKDVL